MPIIPANMGRASWGGKKPGTFNPSGAVRFYGDKSVFERGSWQRATQQRRNPLEEDDVETAAIRFFIGFNVGGKPKWKISDVERIVSEVRIRQMGHPDATYVAQMGTYTHHHGKKIVKEKGCQLIIMNMPHWNISTDEFHDQMEELGETLCQRLKQELILGEWQVNGIVEKNWRVTS